VSNVSPIRPGLADKAIIDAQPDEILVGYLEELLAEARAGQLQGLVWAGLYPGDLTAWGRGGLVTSAVIGKLEIAKMHCVRTAIEDEEQG
jgi:hypothetical protein